MLRLILWLAFTIIWVHCQHDPEELMTAAEIIQHWGYPVESHELITADGYILLLLRIHHGRRSKGNNDSCLRPPILLVHGLFSDAAEFVLNPPESSPAMILADAGFDVFLLNVRGTTHSQRHVNLTRDDDDFWKFTMDDMAKYDATAAIDKALELNGANSLYWIGHSQGTLVGFFLLADRPEYNRKVRALIQVAPVGTLRGAKGLLRVIKWILIMFKQQLHDNPQEIGLHNPPLVGDVTRFLCPPINRETRVAVYLSNHFVSTSSWSFLQYLQNYLHNFVSHYDVSSSENLKRYGDVIAPPYNYNNIDTDVYLFWSRNDWMTTPLDIEGWLIPQMRPEAIKACCDTFEIPEYNHADYMFATDLADRVFKKIIAIMRKYESNVCVE